jgi:phosphoribosyl-ATP pyrophosphohydrolase
MNDKFIEELFNRLGNKVNIDPNVSYTAKLINEPELLAKKIGEETTELIIDFIKKNKKGIIHESADIIYHLLVLWVAANIRPKDVWAELSKRKIKSGFEEKSSRDKDNGQNL